MDTTVKNLSDLPALAEKLIDFANGEKIFVFEGDMGAGKTTFIKSLCAKLGVLDAVSSPTYSIVNEYQGKSGAVFHFDFYRIKDLHEAYDLGYEEYFYGGGICLIEWPERVEELLPDHYIKIQITALNETERLFNFRRI